MSEKSNEVEIDPKHPPDEIHVAVTQDHIDRGIPRNPSCCPIALAVKELLKERSRYLDSVSVDPKYITIYGPYGTLEGATDYEMPFEVTAFINSFDGSRDLQLYTFDDSSDVQSSTVKRGFIRPIEFTCKKRRTRPMGGA